MATYDLEEQEQLAELQSWWKVNGNLVVGVIVVAALAFAGWRYWRVYQAGEAVQAAALYETLGKAAQANDAKAPGSHDSGKNEGGENKS